MLTELEKKIMDVLSKLGEADVKRIKEALAKDNGKIPYTTIASTLERLYKKGFVKRKEVKSRGRLGKKYVYYVEKSVEDVFAEKILENFVKIFGEYEIHHLEDKIDKKYVYGVSESVIFVDKDDRVVFFFTATGKRIEEVVGKEVYEFHPEDVKNFVKQILEDFKTGRRDKFERTIIKGDYVFKKHYFPIRNSRGEYIGTLILTRLLEERKDVELEELLI